MILMLKYFTLECPVVSDKNHNLIVETFLNGFKNERNLKIK